MTSALSSMYCTVLYVVAIQVTYTSWHDTKGAGGEVNGTWWSRSGAGPPWGYYYLSEPLADRDG
jgi:hypothetical protein